MNEPEKPKKGWGWLQWGVVIMVLFMIGAFAVPLYNWFLLSAYQGRQARQGREIILCLKVFAQDWKSRYPDSFQDDSTSANKVFRRLIHEEILADDTVFGGQISPYWADGKIGTAPAYDQAVEPGENHWMMLGGQSLHHAPEHPLIYENALDATWPPYWKPQSAGRMVRGRTWNGGRILIGLNDGSVVTAKTRDPQDTFRLPASMQVDRNGRLWTDIEVLDIEEKK